MTQNTTAPQNKIRHNWKALFQLTVFSAYFYAFMEWVFFATKPSSLSILAPAESVIVLVVAGGTVALSLIISLVLLSIPAWLVKSPAWRKRLHILRYIPVTLMLSVTALILVDNFTYTVFKFGIVSTWGVWGAIYTLGFGIIFWRMMRFAKRTTRRSGKIASILSLSLLAVSAAGFAAVRLSGNMSPGNSDPRDPSSEKYPNIIVLGSDGLSANYLSVYGSSQDTTPFLSELVKTSLVAENAFPNVSSTTGSITSVLTGKAPITIKVFRYPDILSGEDSFEHLPGILKKEGYRTVEIGTPYYVDAQRLNLMDGFDIVNNRSLDLPALDVLRTVLGNSPSMYFIQTILDRAGERLLHIFFIREMRNPLAEVNDHGNRMTDGQRVDQIIDQLDHADRPVFILAHLMDTHGPAFSSQKHVISGAITGEEEWDENLYKDSILTFDGHVRKIYEYLKQSGKLEDTILVIYTDHGFKYAVNHRIPIIIHFPRDSYMGARVNNVQIVDIPVTLLDYLGLPKPEWMTGISMLGEEPPADRGIIGIVASSPKKIAPPFHQIKTMQLIVCQKWYALNVQENTWSSGSVKGHTAKCDEDLLPSDDDARQTILEYLRKYNYDIGSLQ